MTTTPGPVLTPMDVIVEIEGARVRLGKKKQELARLAGIKAEMYSYLLKRGRQGHALPEDCLEKIQKALRKLEHRKRSA